MLRLIVAILVLAFACGGAEAADDTLLVQPSVSESPDWTGPYVGLSVGYGWLRDVDNSFVPPLPSFGEDVVFGGHFGYLHQARRFAFGLEAEFTRLDINFQGFPIDAENSFAIRARGGFAVGSFLITGHIGPVYATTNIGLEDWGWVAGTSVEYLITEKLVGGLSFDHMWFDRFDGTLIDARLDLVKARLSLKF